MKVINTIILTKLTYDSLFRVEKIEKKVANSKLDYGAIPYYWKTIAVNEYDALSQLKKKTLSPTGGPGGGHWTLCAMITTSVVGPWA